MPLVIGVKTSFLFQRPFTQFSTVKNSSLKNIFVWLFSALPDFRLGTAGVATNSLRGN